MTIQNCGRTLTFEKPPSRVVLPYHPVAEIFMGLGLGARAVGRAGWEGGLKQPPIRDRAEQRVASMQAQIAQVGQKVSSEPKIKVIAYGGGQGPLQLSGGRDSITTKIVEAAGGENIFAENKTFFNASLEAVATKPADAFLIFTSSKEPMIPWMAPKRSSSCSAHSRT